LKITSPLQAVVFLAVATVPVVAATAPAQPVRVEAAAPADALIASLEPPIAELATEVLSRNPDLARLRSVAMAAAARAPQVRSLPDPMASLTAFLLTPETRVGPQQATATLSQRFPWFGKLALRERAALYRSAAARAEVEARRLTLVTETLVHYEEVARGRYASGVGLEQAVVKLQAEISKDDLRLLEIGHRRAGLVAALAALRDRDPDAPLPLFEPAAGPTLPELDLDRWSQEARSRRPEMIRARALVAAARAGGELAQKEYKPDFTLGLGYTLVGRREDGPGRVQPPPGNGDDIVGVTLGVNLPVRRRRLVAGLAEAAAREGAADEMLRAVEAGIDQVLGELAARLPLTDDQLQLFDRLLITQAEEALRSADAAYAAGAASALDLLDAERVLLDVRIGAARLQSDYLIALARLEGALGAPLANLQKGDAS
jgi:outer membrane protein TolC